MLTQLQREKRVKRCHKIKNFLRHYLKGRVLVFSDERDFHVDKYLNRRNDRYIASSVKDAKSEGMFVSKSKYPDKAMMLGYVGSDGTAFPPTCVNGTINASKYKNVLVKKVIPSLDNVYECGGYVWTQDGAPAHTSDVAQNYLENKLGSKGFWPKKMWPSSSPNLNPLDFSIWGHIETTACASSHSNVDDLKASVDQVWTNMPRDYIHKTCKAFRRRLDMCVAAERGVFEK